jgi:DMSO/TMAO reductase YedYZ heme-binding membrane subunit
MLRGIRKYILLLNLILIVAVLIFVKVTISNQSDLQIIRFTQITALFASLFLYLTLLVSPITKIFANIPFRNHVILARQSLGISAFSFAVLHSNTAFFFQLGGLSGLQYLKTNYFFAISISIISLIILTILAITSVNFMAKKCGRYWKNIHRLIYLASFLIIVHALMLGTHTRNLSNILPLISLLLFIVLIVLESIRIDLYLVQRTQSKNRNITLIIAVISITALVSLNFNSWPINGLSIHK